MAVKTKKSTEFDVKNDAAVKGVASTKQRSPKIMQTNMPSHSLEDALAVPRAIWDNLAGKPSTPLQVCTALDMSPTSSKFRDLSGAAIAYGITTGGWNAKNISLEQLGKRIVAPTEEGDDVCAIREAVMKPGILKRFFEYYDGKKFPKDVIAENMLIEWGVPKERASKVLALIKENGYFAGILVDIKGSPYIDCSGSTGDGQKTEDCHAEPIKDEEEIPQEWLDKLLVKLQKKQRLLLK